MPEMKQLEVLTIPHPGEYDIQVIHGGPVAYFKDEELPQSVAKGHATVETSGRLHLLATGNALVSISEHVPAPRKARKTKAAKTSKPAKKGK